MSQTISSPINPDLQLTPDLLEGDLIQPGHRLFGIVWINRDRVSGAPCFTGTRVPIKILFDHLENGETLNEFLDGFPPVTREQAVALLEYLRNGLEAKFDPR